jgi:hypothetical protein
MNGVSQVSARASAGMLIALLTLGGCATVPQPGAIERAALEKRAEKLAADLAALGPDVAPAEAAEFARIAIFYPLDLAARYELTTPPLWHNTLVNFGIKPRGLCVQWAQDLLDRLEQVGASTLQLHWGIANQVAVFQLEHYAVVITAPGQPLKTGIVLDAWRDSGKWFWAPVARDEHYAWVPLHDTREQ